MQPPLPVDAAVCIATAGAVGGPHDAGIHADLDVPELLARFGAELPRAHHRADRAGPRNREIAGRPLRTPGR